MKLTKTLGLAFLVLYAATAHAVVTFDWATVGNPGNGGDVQAWGTFGAVSSVYRISKYEVTNDQYRDFLNAVDPTGNNPNSIYSSYMGSNARGGIAFNSGAASGSKYSTKTNMGNKPVTFVSFFDAMRFTNWLENGQPTGGSGTETGVYSIGNGLNETRAPGATFFIPSEDEWYKAAYHDVTAGTSATYFDYPISSDTIPTSEPPAGGTNSANYFDLPTGFAVTGSTLFDSAQNYLTDVGAYASSTSPYGTFDQGGNVFEWNEAVISVISSSFRGLRGGKWFFDSHSSWPRRTGSTSTRRSRAIALVFASQVSLSQVCGC